jgi:hypothetical protein
LQLLLEEPDDGILYIFYDDNQRIYVPEGSFPIQTPPHLLSVNCRNTQAIHRVVNGFYKSGAQPAALGPSGRPVEVQTYTDWTGLRSQLESLLAGLAEEGIPPEGIAVLAMTGKQVSLFQEAGLSNTWPPQPGEIFCTTVHAFKGLESPVVVLAGIESWMLKDWQDMDKLIYVGSSRARHHLAVILSEHAAESLRGHFQ